MKWKRLWFDSHTLPMKNLDSHTERHKVNGKKSIAEEILQSLKNMEGNRDHPFCSHHITDTTTNFLCT